jgi:anti-sigma regulatory factor (Ser/Thr protein kinase)
MDAWARFRCISAEIPAARMFVRDTLVRWHETERLADAVLITSELFTNAVLHGSGDVDVGVELGPTDVRINVLDAGGKGSPVVVRGTLPATVIGGRGLRVVEALAAEWGSTRDAAGRRQTWAEFSRG